MTFADHAEQWWQEQGNAVPERNTKDWERMYEQWHTYAFADFAPKEKASEPVRIRHNGFDELYLSRRGKWVEWSKAAKFVSQEAAEQFAAKHEIEVYGLF